MRSERIIAWATLGAAAIVAAAGCSSPAPVPVPGFTDGTGEAKNAASYPAGPYGLGVGSVIANFDFLGYPNAMASMAQQATIKLADFYNPHAFDKTYQPASPELDDRLFPADSGFAMAGKAKPTVLLIDIASVWCVPCNNEAKGILPQKHALYANCGGEFLLDLHDSNTPGKTATFANLNNWTKSYKVNYPAVIDPAYKLDALFGVDAYPNNFIIDLTTMKVVEVFAGEVIAKACGDASGCNTDADCTICQGVCNDGSAYCQTDADCGASVGCGTQHACGDGTNCSTDADCSTKTCTAFSFWRTYEAHLDKSRAGCTVK